jgi:hypothetical protein
MHSVVANPERRRNVNNQDNTAAAAAALAGFGLIWILVVLCGLVLGIVINWRIASKAGYDGALSLLMLIPLANVVVLLMFAFSDWPIERELSALRARAGGGSGDQPGTALWQPPMQT